MLKFIEIYNLDETYNGLLNVNYIIKIIGKHTPNNPKTKEKWIRIAYYMKDYYEAIIKENDYKELIGLKKEENKKEVTKK